MSEYLSFLQLAHLVQQSLGGLEHLPLSVPLPLSTNTLTVGYLWKSSMSMIVYTISFPLRRI